MTKASAATKRWREAFKLRDPTGFKLYRQRERRARYLKSRDKQNAQSVAWQKRNPEKVKGYKRKCRMSKTYEERASEDLTQKYGITYTQKQDLLKRQGGHCAICGNSAPPKTKCAHDGWCVDHCHAYEARTGGIKIRGILCIACNSVLGLARDNEHVLLSAVAYLRKHKDQEVGLEIIFQNSHGEPLS